MRLLEWNDGCYGNVCVKKEHAWILLVKKYPSPAFLRSLDLENYIAVYCQTPY